MMNWHQIMEKALAELKGSGATAAEPYLRQALDAAGDKIEFQAMTYFNYGLVLYDLKRPADAEKSFAHAIELVQELLPKQNELYGMFLKTMIEFYEKEKRFAESKKYYLLEIEHTANMFGPKHPYVANMTQELAGQLLKCGDYKEAEKYLSKALDIMSGAKGADHVSNASIHRDLANCYAALNAADDAKYHEARAQALDARLAKKEQEHSQDLDSLGDEAVEMPLD